MNKEKIAILVDSGTDVPQELMEKHQMFMIPLKIIYKDRVYTDKVDITPEEIYEKLTARDSEHFLARWRSNHGNL
jgi:fatty acid-binding protein DegV